MSSDIPRRNIVSKMTDAERGIYNAIIDVEALRADERLTEAVTLLKKAQNLVADFVDGYRSKSDSNDLCRYHLLCASETLFPGKSIEEASKLIDEMAKKMEG